MTRTSTRRRYLVASVAAGVAAIAGCSDEGDDEEAPAAGEEETENDTETDTGSAAPSDENGSETDEDDPVEEIDHAEVDGSLSFVTPEDGAEVSSPVTVGMEVEGFELRAVDEADAPEDGSGHLHVIVDEDCIDPGYVIPQEDGYHHLSDGGRETELELEAGTYDLCAQAGDAQHNAYALSDEITIEVTDGGGGGNETGGNETDGDDSSDGGENGTNVDEEQ